MTDRQPSPRSDNRYRVHRSVKCYLAHLACGEAGCTWYFSSSVERVVHLFPGRVEKVQYKNNFYALQSSERMKELVLRQFALGAAVHIGGYYVAPHERRDFTAYPFIDISSAEDQQLYRRFVSALAPGDVR